MTRIRAMQFNGLAIEEIEVGMRAAYSHTVTDADVKAYAGLSGDNNPVHMSDEFAEHSRFGERIAHGLYSAGFFSAIFGTRLPGPGCVYAAQNLRFKKPIYLGDTVVAEVIVTSLDRPRRRVFFSTICTVKETVVIEGEAEIYMTEHFSDKQNAEK
jgi:3-hydroxybutyryl-CoA dehydratase